MRMGLFMYVKIEVRTNFVQFKVYNDNFKWGILKKIKIELKNRQLF